MTASGLRLGCWALVCVLLSACASERVISVSEFELSVPDTGIEMPIVIPRHLDELLPAHDSEYTLRAQVTLPEDLRGRTLTLAIPHLFARATLFVDGLEMVELDPEPASMHRSLGTPRFRIPATLSEREQVDLALRVRHTWTQSAWLDTPMRISATLAGDSFSRFVNAFNRNSGWFGFATVLVTCITSLLAFLLDRRQRAFGWFALEAGFGFTMPLFQTGTGAAVFGVYDTLMMGAGVSLALWASVRFTHAQFELGRPHRVFDVLLAFTLLLLVSNLSPFAMTQRAGKVVIGFISLNVVYQIYAMVRLRARGVRKEHALVLAVSWGVLGVTAAADQLAWVGLGELFGGLRAGALGVSAIGLLQASVLSHDYITTLRRADALNVELAERIRLLESKDLENSALNEVLRRQIAARSEQLAHAIARLGTARPIVPGELSVGAVLEDRYRIEGVLGRGGMGTVYEVQRIADKKTFALKVLSGQGGSIEMARFAREAQLVAQLQHPNVVSIVDVDVATNGLLFIVLELVRGKSLREHLERGRNDRAFALEVLRQIAEGLVAIHSQGILHRDLKPENILVVGAEQGSSIEVKIADFGVSVVAGSARKGASAVTEAAPDPDDLTVPLRVDLEQPSPRENLDTKVSRPSAATTPQTSDALTQAGVVVGTPRYMAPEAGDDASPAVDIFSFGVLAFELLTGRAPYSEPLIMARIAKRLLPEPLDLGLLAPDVAPEIVKLLERCLMPDPAARPSADELQRELGAYVNSGRG